MGIPEPPDSGWTTEHLKQMPPQAFRDLIVHADQDEDPELWEALVSRELRDLTADAFTAARTSIADQLRERYNTLMAMVTDCSNLGDPNRLADIAAARAEHTTWRDKTVGLQRRLNSTTAEWEKDTGMLNAA